LLIFGVVVHPQSSATLGPPDQAYVYNFDATVSASAPAAPPLNLGASYSIEFWMMLNPYMRDPQTPTGVPQIMQVFIKNGDTAPAYSLSLAAGTHQLTYITTGYSQSAIGASLVLGQWYHIAIVSDNLQVTLYLNGQQQARFKANGPPQSTSNPLVLAQNIPGSLRQFRIWGRALQTAEINSVATKVLTGSEPGLLADWPLDDGHGEALRDTGPNHLALSLVHGYLKGDELYPDWMRTAVVNEGPYFQERSLLLPEALRDAKESVLLMAIDFD
jgi:hypothetical protein